MDRLYTDTTDKCPACQAELQLVQQVWEEPDGAGETQYYECPQCEKRWDEFIENELW